MDCLNIFWCNEFPSLVPAISLRRAPHIPIWSLNLHLWIWVMIITVNGSELSQLCLCQKCGSTPTIPNVPPFSWVKRGVKLCESWVPHFLLSFSHGPWFITVYNFTSSIAQGGGGSFKNRKPIGEVGCCESRTAERIHWWTERWLELCFLKWLQWLQWSPRSVTSPTTAGCSVV